jgi:hypothetical protein
LPKKLPWFGYGIQQRKFHFLWDPLDQKLLIFEKG